MLEVQRSVPTPIFQQISEWMQEQIRSGKWPQHYKLPSETDLAAELSVNRGTVRKAIARLISEGALTTIHGRGTFVSSNEIAQPLAERLVTFSEELLSKGIDFETRVIDRSVGDPPYVVASMLAMQPGTRAFSMTRLRLVAEEPIAYLRNHVRYDLCPGIEKIDFTTHRLFDTLENRYKLGLGWGQRSFEARLADRQVAAALGIEREEPVMYLQQVVYLKDNSPVEFSEVWFRGDRFRLSAVVRRNREYWAPGGSREILSVALPPEDGSARQGS